MKRLAFLLMGLLVAGGLAGTAAAAELTGTLKKIKDGGAITIGHRDSSIPFSYYDDKQQPIALEGLFNEIVGTDLDCLDGRFDRAVAADHDNRH